MSSKVETKPVYSGKERRQYARTKLDTMVDIVISEQTFFFDFALNFSLGGFFFETDKTLTLNHTVDVLFPLPLENWIFKAKATPIWFYKNPDEHAYDVNSPEGYGFKFESFASQEDHKKMETYLKNPPDLSQISAILE